MQKDNFKEELYNNLYYRCGAATQSATAVDVYTALVFTVRDRIADRWQKTVETRHGVNPKFVYYLSMEFLLGKQLHKNLFYTELEETAREALAEFGYSLEDMLLIDPEPGLGNGGLGRLAACFLDSLATLDIPAVGYGIRYEFGIFEQKFEDGFQVEHPDHWLDNGNPWEYVRLSRTIPVGFYGYTEHTNGTNGDFKVRWHPSEVIVGEPYHSFVPGYNTGTVNLLRLWRARASQAFDFELFDRGEYNRAVSGQVASESVSKVLYPNDNSDQGKELRLKQQYFFVACSLRDIIRRFHLRNDDWSVFPDKVSIQLNDTHPVIAIPELMRILLDEEGLSWDKAWEICHKTFAYTNHTLMPEALETWSATLFNRLLPRHMEITGEINRRFLDEVRLTLADDQAKVERMAIVANEYGRQVNMAHLATVGSTAVNGVAEIQSRLLKERVLSDFAAMYPEKFQNKTNGVTPRRFIALANPRLRDLINDTIGDGWLNNLEALRGLEAYVDDEAFVQTWQEIKVNNKADLAAVIHAKLGLEVSSHSMFDVMVKRLHEYKRQLLKVLHIITLYQRLKAQPDRSMPARTFVFGAKAAPGYRRAKMIIKLVNSVAEVVNADEDSRDMLKVAFIPNFNVSVAESIYPAANLSEQISMAGKEASGTGNMKFALNGALTVGTLDGANIEIRERVGAENFFLFGLTTEEVFGLKGQGYRPRDYYHRDEELREVIDSISRGDFSRGDPQLFAPLVNDLLTNDEYLHLADYRAYVDIQDDIDVAYGDTTSWTKMSILNAARCGFFSSDRTIQQYADEIWRVKSVPVPLEAQA